MIQLRYSEFYFDITEFQKTMKTTGDKKKIKNYWNCGECDS